MKQVPSFWPLFWFVSCQNNTKFAFGSLRDVMGHRG